MADRLTDESLPLLLFQYNKKSRAINLDLDVNFMLRHTVTH